MCGGVSECGRDDMVPSGTQAAVVYQTAKTS